jgi:hypothetical protein
MMMTLCDPVSDTTGCQVQKAAATPAYDSVTNVVPAPRSQPMRFDVGVPFQGARSLAVPAVDGVLAGGPIVLQVPATWTDAEIFLNPVTTTVKTEACADPSASGFGLDCTTDPAASRFTYAVRDPANVATTATAEVAGTGGTVNDTYLNGFQATLPLSAASALARDSRNVSGSAARFLAPTGNVSAFDATVAVKHFVSVGLPDGLTDLQTATIGSTTYMPPVDAAGPAAWYVPFLDGTGTTIGYAIVSGTYDSTPVLRVSHGDLLALAAQKQTLVQEVTLESVVAQQMEFVDAFTVVDAMTLQDATVVYPRLDSSEVNTATIGPLHLDPSAPPRTGNSAGLAEERWRQLLRGQSDTPVATCLYGSQTAAPTGGGECPGTRSYTAQNSYVPDGPQSANWDWYEGCTPTSGSMLEGYWSQHGFTGFMSATDYAQAQSAPDGQSTASHNLIDLLRGYMKSTRTVEGDGTVVWTTPYDTITSGLYNFEHDHGAWPRYTQEFKNPKFSAVTHMVDTSQVPGLISFSSWYITTLTTGTPGTGTYTATTDTPTDHTVFLIGYFREGYTTNTGANYISNYMIAHTDAKGDGNAIVAYDGRWSYGQLDYLENNNV